MPAASGGTDTAAPRVRGLHPAVVGVRPLALVVQHLHAAVGGLQPLREPDAHVSRRGPDPAARARVGPVEEPVGIGRRGERKHDQQTDQNAGQSGHVNHSTKQPGTLDGGSGAVGRAPDGTDTCPARVITETRWLAIRGASSPCWWSWSRPACCWARRPRPSLTSAPWRPRPRPRGLSNPRRPSRRRSPRRDADHRTGCDGSPGVSADVDPCRPALGGAGAGGSARRRGRRTSTRPDRGPRASSPGRRLRSECALGPSPGGSARRGHLRGGRRRGAGARRDRPARGPQMWVPTPIGAVVASEPDRPGARTLRPDEGRAPPSA